MTYQLAPTRSDAEYAASRDWWLAYLATLPPGQRIKAEAFARNARTLLTVTADEAARVRAEVE